jgi:hypothetical protein
MIKNSLLILYFICILNVYSKDSTRNLSIVVGSVFNIGMSDLIDDYNNVGVLFSTGTGENTKFRYSMGLKYGSQKTSKKNFNIDLNYSNSYISYFFQTKNINNQLLEEKKGIIDFNTLNLNTTIDYNLYKFIHLKYGLGLTYIAKEQFDDVFVARRINWHNQNGESRVNNKLNLVLNFGAGIKLSKSLQIDYSIFYGFTNYIGIYIDKTTPAIVPQKLLGSNIQLSYRIK